VPSAARQAQKTCPRCQASFDAEAAFCPADGAPLESPEPPPASDPYIGTVISGDIELLAVAGAGAMGRVYRAHQRGIERDVAVKILHRELSGNTQLVQRFHREAKIASRMQHPHVVHVYLAGQLDDGALFIVMEYLDGLSLGAALAAAGGTFPLERALALTIQICDAVGDGHSRQIVHRDLKPENVMLVRHADVDDWVKVLDFGIAKVTLAEETMETAAGLIFGTARYISPEGAQGSKVGPPGDVYSIATMLYQMVSGHTPFDAAQPVGLLIKHIHEPPPDVRTWPKARNLPPPIARVIMENLAKDASRRAPNARAFGTALAAASREANVSFAEVGVLARMSHAEIATARPSVEKTLDDALAATTAAAEVPKIIPVPPPPVGTTSVGGQEAPVSRPERKRSSLVVVVLAFLLGAALAALVAQQLAAPPAAGRDVALDAHVAKTRRALSEGRYVSPPGDNVRDLAAAGRAQWPEDERFEDFRSDAAHALVTRAMAARSVGDVEHARDLVKTAVEFDSSERAATILLEQYEHELTASSDGGAIGAPQVLLAVPVGRARQGRNIRLTARVLTATPTEVTSPRFLVRGPALPDEGLSLPAMEGDAGTFEARMVPARFGDHEIVFLANTNGLALRAERQLRVSP
jgi:eukaryotic-like serine/threonine-protein kinase